MNTRKNRGHGNEDLAERHAENRKRGERPLFDKNIDARIRSLPRGEAKFLRNVTRMMLDGMSIARAEREAAKMFVLNCRGSGKRAAAGCMEV